MSKDDFLQSLSKDQQSFMEFLLDEAYSNGFADGSLSDYKTEYGF